MSDVVSQAIINLFHSERYYAELILTMDRQYCKMGSVAGVRIKDRIELFIDIEKFTELTLEERVAVLKHECEHILRDHIPRAKEIDAEVFKHSKDTAEELIRSWKFKTLNVSMDCAINGNLANLPEWGIFPKNLDLPNGETFEWYLENMKDNEKVKELMEFDGHPLWAESETDKELLRERVRQAVNHAANKTRAAGLMTGDLELLIGKLNKNSVDWRAQLKRFIARSDESKRESSRKKRNRRYGITIPGEVKIDDLHIGVAIDTSGSISDETLQQFMSEIAQVARYAKVTVAEVDSEIKNTYIFKPKKEYAVAGRGGTCYQPAFDFFNKESINGLIYFGDMDCYDNEEIKKPKYPVLWAVFGEQSPPVDWGSRIKVVIK